MTRNRRRFDSFFTGLLRLVYLAALAPLAASANELEGRITRIIDGDTLVITDSAQRPHTIHLLGADAPELVQDFGQQSKTSLSAQALNQQALAECAEQDRYGHDLCIVRIRNKDIGLMQVRQGMAWWHQKHVLRQTPPMRNLYQQAEFNAKIRRFGLWSGKNPTPPWNWRHGRLEE